MGPLSEIPELEPDFRSTVVEIPINDNVSIIVKEPKDQEHIEEPPPPPVENTNFYTANFVKCFILLLVTGSTSTLLAKYETLIPIEEKVFHKSNGSVSITRDDFNHPMLQTGVMFAAEFCCLLVYIFYDFLNKILTGPDEKMQLKHSPKFIFTALLDLVASYFLFYGLSMTKASSYQMLRGTVIIFTGLYQWLFWKKKFTKSMVMAMVLIILGLIVAEISNLTNSKEEGNEALIGDFMVFGCMFLNAWNWSMREGILKKYTMNTMNAVGLEGLYGLLFMAILLPLMAIVPKYSSHVDDVIDGFKQMGKNPELLMVAMGVAISTAFSNNAALMMIKERSATLTMIVDNLRTIVVWIMSLAFKWETFDFWQPIGFTVVIFGFVMYTTDCVHLCMLKICPMYERFVNKEDQDEIEKTQTHSEEEEKENVGGNVVDVEQSSQRFSDSNLDV